MRNILLLGASGSIGSQTLEIIINHPTDFKLVGFSLGNRIEKIDEILKNCKDIDAICVKNKQDFDVLKDKYPSISFYYGDEGLVEIVNDTKADMVVNALVGFAGFPPTVKALEQNLIVALANKEALVVGGEIINKLLDEGHGKLYPIDSEHVAISKCLCGGKNVKRIVLTASGGAFKNLTREELKNVKPSDALKHPTWNMGQKITIDCATMMNKGFEVIEAYYLFRLPLDKIDVLLHDESKIHSMVEYEDGSFLADIGPSDMRIPISYALYEGQRKEVNHFPFGLDDFTTFHFHKYDSVRYPCVEYARKALTIGGSMPTILNASNEVAVHAFLDGKINFLDIEKIISSVMNNLDCIYEVNVAKLINADHQARDEAEKIIKELQQCKSF